MSAFDPKRTLKSVWNLSLFGIRSRLLLPLFDRIPNTDIVVCTSAALQFAPQVALIATPLAPPYGFTQQRIAPTTRSAVGV
jgi:hypothetical protein